MTSYAEAGLQLAEREEAANIAHRARVERLLQAILKETCGDHDPGHD